MTPQDIKHIKKRIKHYSELIKLENRKAKKHRNQTLIDLFKGRLETLNEWIGNKPKTKKSHPWAGKGKYLTQKEMKKLEEVDAASRPSIKMENLNDVEKLTLEQVKSNTNIDAPEELHPAIQDKVDRLIKEEKATKYKAPLTRRQKRFNAL